MRFAFMDIQASSADNSAWPIEIGISTLIAASGEVRTWSSLVKPHSSWPSRSWSEEHRITHHIHKDDLKTAASVDEVSAKASDMIDDAILIGDDAEKIGRLANRLFYSGGVIKTMKIRPVDAFVEGLLSPAGIMAASRHLQKNERKYRAAPDSRRLAEACALGLKITRLDPDAKPLSARVDELPWPQKSAIAARIINDLSHHPQRFETTMMQIENFDRMLAFCVRLHRERKAVAAEREKAG